ncbi:MAG: GDYXXLXY domain-containing protein [Myxococcota bacterium]
MNPGPATSATSPGRAGGVGRILALLLPLLGLGWGWLSIHHHAQQGLDWDVPVEGFDPRDLLRGHYVLYRYRWPGLEPAVDPAPIEALCIEGRPPNIDRASPLESEEAERCTSIARSSARDRSEAHGLESGLYYVDQTRARSLEEALRDPAMRAILRIRVRDDGVVRPLDLRFEPRSPSAPIRPDQ